MTDSDMKSIEDATLSGKIESYIVDPGTGEKIKCYYADPTEEQRRRLEQLEETQQNAMTGDKAQKAAQEIEELVCDELFLSDKVDSDSGLALKQAVIAGLFRALGANDAIEDAQELMRDMNQGNQ